MDTNNIYDIKVNLDTKTGRYYLMFEREAKGIKKGRGQRKPKAWLRYHYADSLENLIETLPSLSSIGDTRLMSAKKIPLTDEKLKLKIMNTIVVENMFFSDFDLYSTNDVKFTTEGYALIKSYLDRYNGLERIFLPNEVENIKDAVRQQLIELKENAKAELDVEIFITHIFHLIKYRKPMGE